MGNSKFTKDDLTFFSLFLGLYVGSLKPTLEARRQKMYIDDEADGKEPSLIMKNNRIPKIFFIISF